MKIQLVCSEKNASKLTELLLEKGFEISNDSDYILYEKNMDKKAYIFGRELNDNMSLIEYKNIIYFDSSNKMVTCVTETGKFEVKKKLYELENLLVFSDFIRVNKSVIVNIMMIKKIIPWIGMKYVLVMKNDEKVDVNRSYFANFKKRLEL
jgi:DNA-binding LytR/AlgR family response regulator